MLQSESIFTPLSSIPAKGLTIALKGFLLGFFILILGTLVGMIIFSFLITGIEIKLILLGFSVPVLCFLVWVAIAEYRSKNPKYTQILVDEKGMHHSGKDTPVQSLFFESLFSNNEGGIYDVLWTDRGYSEGDFDLYIFTKNELGTIKARPVKLNTVSLIQNSNALMTHFVRGIILFRPDLKIAPEVLEKYHKLHPVTDKNIQYYTQEK